VPVSVSGPSVPASLIDGFCTGASRRSWVACMPYLISTAELLRQAWERLQSVVLAETIADRVLQSIFGVVLERCDATLPEKSAVESDCCDSR